MVWYAAVVAWIALSSAGQAASADSWTSAEALGCGAVTGGVVSLHALDDAIWIGGQDALYEVRGGECTRHTEQKAIRSMTQALSATWAVTEGGHRLWRLRDGAWARHQGTVGTTTGKAVAGSACYQPLLGSARANPEVHEGIPWVRSGPVKLVSSTDGADLWLMYADGPPHAVVRFGGERLECWDDAFVSRQFSDAAALPSGEMWFVSLFPDPLLARFAGGEWFLDAPPVSIVHLSVATDGSILGGGTSVYRYRDEGWLVLADVNVLALVGDNRGGAWAVQGSREVVHIRHDGSLTTYGRPDTPEPKARVSLAVGHDGVPWLGTEFGAYRLNLVGSVVQTRSWGELKREGPPPR